MTRILFVDDERLLLDGLRRTLHSMRREWNMTFVSSAEQALDVIARQPVDVIVSDVRMPGMDGIRLLNKVRQQHPEIIRLALSGHTDRTDTMMATGVVHQFLAKPVELEVIKTAISRSFTLRQRLESEALLRVVAGLEVLPSMPLVYAKVSEELNRPEPSLTYISQIAAQDAGLATKILQLVNSSFFGIRRQVTDLSQALVLLGLDTFMSLVLVVHLFQALTTSGVNLDELWRNGVWTARVARALAHFEGLTPQECADAYLAGLLHDAGRLILAVNLPETFREIEDTRSTTGLVEAERRVLGSTHQEIGAYLVGLWGIPDTIVEAIAFHHHPSAAVADGPAPLTFAHAAAALRPASDVQLDLAYLERIGVLARFDDWSRVPITLVEGEEEG